MSCINVSASIFSTSIVASGKFVPNINVSASIFSTSIVASGKFVCAIPSESIIKFEKDCLVWSNSDNRVGTIKYNTLTSTHSWSLEEIEIEELL